MLINKINSVNTSYRTWTWVNSLNIILGWFREIVCVLELKESSDLTLSLMLIQTKGMEFLQSWAVSIVLKRGFRNIIRG